MSTPQTFTAYRLCCQARLAERDGKGMIAATLYTSAAAQFAAAGRREQSAQCYTNASRCRFDATKRPA